MKKPPPPHGHWQWVEYETSSTQRGMSVAEPQRPRLVDAKGQEVRRKVGFLPHKDQR